MTVQYFRAIDGLGRIVLPAELLHHLNWENVCFYWRKGWLLNRFFRPGCRSNPRTARTDNRKSFLCRCLKNDKTAFLSSNKKAVFCCFCSFGGWTSTVGRFWKIGPKKPENPHEYWKKSGWHLFRHPFLERETGIEPACSAWEADILPLNYSRIFIIQ